MDQLLSQSLFLMDYFQCSYQREGKIYRAYCPFHPGQHRPTLAIYEDGALYCFSCHRRYKGPHFLLLEYLYQKTDNFTAEEFRSVYKIIGNFGSSAYYAAQPLHRQQEIAAVSDEARALFRHVAETCYHPWFMEDRSTPARIYWEQERSLSPRAYPYIGYMPDSALADLALLRTLKEYSSDWYILGEEAGVLRHGHPQMRNRIILWDQDIRYYQARSFEKDDPRKYLTPRGWSAEPIFLPGDRPGLHILEGLIDGITIHQFGYPTIVSWGTGPIVKAAIMIQQAMLKRQKIVVWKDLGSGGDVFVDRIRLITKDYPIQICMTPPPIKDVNEWFHKDRQSMQAALLAA